MGNMLGPNAGLGRTYRGRALLSFIKIRSMVVCRSLTRTLNLSLAVDRSLLVRFSE